MIEDAPRRLVGSATESEDTDVSDIITHAVAQLRRRRPENSVLDGDIRSEVDWLLSRVRRLESTGAESTGAVGTDAPIPFDVTFVSVGELGDLTASVVPGTVNNILGTNWATPFTISSTGTYYLVTAVVTADAQVTSHTLAMDGSAPSTFPVNMGLPPTSFDVLIGIVIDGTWYRTIGPGSISAQSLEAYRTSKAAPAPGTLPYDIWYTWAAVGE